MKHRQMKERQISSCVQSDKKVKSMFHLHRPHRSLFLMWVICKISSSWLTQCHHLTWTWTMILWQLYERQTICVKYTNRQTMSLLTRKVMIKYRVCLHPLLMMTLYSNSQKDGKNNWTKTFRRSNITENNHNRQRRTQRLTKETKRCLNVSCSRFIARNETILYTWQ